MASDRAPPAATSPNSAPRSERNFEARLAALLELNDRFRDLEDPAEIAYAAAEILGRSLNVSRAGYGTIDPKAETITIERDWNAPGIQSLAGVLHFRDYGSYIDDLKRGRTVVFADAEKDPRTAETAEALKAISAQSVVNMPINEQGGFVALLYLNHATAREWSRDELDFIRDVAERTRAVVERRRVERELKESAERFRTVFENAAVGMIEIDADWQILGANAAYCDIVGISRDELVEQNCLAFTHEDDIELSQSALRTAAAGPTLCMMLMSIPSVRSVGVTLIASAGLAALAVGAAAQPALKNLVSGLQMAFTEPIRIDDVVIIDGEWGRIEEIRLTYVVVKLWDERRLVVPVSRILEQSFQNWTRTTSQIVGTVFWYLDQALTLSSCARSWLSWSGPTRAGTAASSICRSPTPGPRQSRCGR